MASVGTSRFGQILRECCPPNGCLYQVVLEQLPGMLYSVTTSPPAHLFRSIHQSNYRERYQFQVIGYVPKDHSRWKLAQALKRHLEWNQRGVLSFMREWKCRLEPQNYAEKSSTAWQQLVNRCFFAKCSSDTFATFLVLEIVAETTIHIC